MNSFDQATFENFNTAPGYYRQNSLLKALNAAHAFAVGTDRWLWIYGNSGVGKTHLCYAVRNYLRRSRQQVNLISFYEMIPWLRDQSPNRERKYEAFLQTEILILDDIHWLYRPDNALDNQAHQILTDILSVRHFNRYSTLLVSLQKPETLLANFAALIASTCDFVEIEAPDYRRRPSDEKK